MKNALNILLMFTLFQSSAQNLVPNGDFEIGPDSSSMGWTSYIDTTFCTVSGSCPGPDSWVHTSGSPDRMVAGSVFTCNWDDGQAYSGNTWLVFGYLETGKATLLSPVIQNQMYRIRAYLKKETMAGQTSLDHRLIFVLNNGVDSITTPYTGSFSNWTLFDTTFVANGNATEIIVGGFEPTNSGSKIDSLSLVLVQENGINELNSTNKMVDRIIDTMGRETEDKPNTLLIYIYSDGTAEKVFRVE